MKTLITLLFAGIFVAANAQEQQTTLRLSLDGPSCTGQAQFQINLQVCEPADRQQDLAGMQESQRDWSEFTGIDGSFGCGETLSQQGCEAVFRLDGHALDKVLSVSIVKIENGAMQIMQIMVPVQKATDQTEIVINDIPFQVTSVNLKNKLEARQQKVAVEKKLVLVPAKEAF